jgi:hypothetical protein
MRSVAVAEQYFYFNQVFGRSKSCAFINNVLLRVEGKVDIKRLESCFVKLINTQDTLRATYSFSNMIVYEDLKSVDSFAITRITDLSSPLLRIVASLQSVFDLKIAPQIRAYYIQHCDGSHLLIQLPHINSDGWSINIVIRHLCHYYRHSEQTELLKVIPFDTYRFALAKYQESSFFQKDKLFWETRIKKQVSSGHSFNISDGKSSSFCGTIPDQLVKKIDEFAANRQTSLFQTFLFVTFLLLHKVTRDNCVRVLFTVHNRTFQMFVREADFDETVGLFVNRLTAESLIDGSEIMIDLFEKVKDDLMMLMKHHKYPFERIVENVDRQYRKSFTQFHFNFIEYKASFNFSEELTLHRDELYKEEETLPLSIDISITSGLIKVWLASNGVYDKDDLKLFFTFFCQLIHQISTDPHIEVSKLIKYE